MDVLPEVCVICKEVVEAQQASSTLTEKGAVGINSASKSRGSNILAIAGSKVHISCRKVFTEKKDIALSNRDCSGPSAIKRSIRAAQGPYNNRTDCLFYGTVVDFSSKYKPKSEQVRVRTDEFAETITNCCKNRCDEWSFVVRGKIEYFHSDLHAADCVYHNSCSVNFRNGKNIPQEYVLFETQSKKLKAGRPTNQQQEDAFLKTCSFLDANDEEQLRISDLVSTMESFLEGSDCNAYERRHMKRKLDERYGNSIVISGESGKSDVVTLKETADNILRAYYEKPRVCDINLQKIQLIEAAAKLIRSDIKLHESSMNEQYPSTHNLIGDQALEYLPDSLKLLCSKLFVGKDVSTKVGSIGQCIMQAVRPRAIIAPLQIGLAVQMHGQFRSKYLIETLHAMGFCSSYSEVKKFERNAASVVGADLLHVQESSTVLLAADNVDHNMCTLNGENTFHGMGMIAAITPGKKLTRIIPRRSISDSDIKCQAAVNIIEYREGKHLLMSIKFQPLPAVTYTDNKLDILWQMSWLFKAPVRPGWSGMMQAIHSDSALEHAGRASVVFLPIIDMAPSDMSCILSTLQFLSNLAYKQKVPAIITFDQPLFWKASQIIYEVPNNSDLRNIVLMLGSFHTLMNHLGSIGTLMNGSGLSEILQEIYGANAVVHMMSGKAVSRVVRGHAIVDAALSALVATDVFPRNADQSNDSLIKEASALYEDAMAHRRPLQDIVSSPVLSNILAALTARKDELRSSNTSQLWLEYQRMVSTARKLITADRSGSWDLHLQAISEALPIAAAAGHHNYLKSAYLYLQNMFQLPSVNPLVYSMFQKGLHVIRRSDRFWAGLATDLAIEQMLMRSLKSTGGLTHGSGLTDIQRALWLLSMPVCSEYSLAMQEYTGVSFATSEQHKEMGEARLTRDNNDTEKVLNRLQPISPFHSDISLRNIVSGHTAPSVVNVHELLSIGTELVSKMKDQPVFSYSCKRTDKVKTLASASAVKIQGEDDVIIDPSLLFQRLLIVANARDVNLEDTLRYELCAYPPALFESCNMMRKADKPPLAHAIVEYMKKNSSPAEMEHQPPTQQYVLDGGSLLHRIPWRKGETYETIAKSYANFTVRNYDKAIIIFDGYGTSPSIKSVTHDRRKGTHMSTAVHFTPDMTFDGNKDNFLSNDRNKQGIIHLIAEQLRIQGCIVQHADGDADVDIVKAALSSSERCTTTLIGEDTDLLVLLLWYAGESDFKLFYRSDIKRGKAVTSAFDIYSIRRLLGDDTSKFILFLHAFTGCDTTSRIFGIGKSTAFQKLLKNEDLRSEAAVFCSEGRTHEEIECAGQKAMLVLFGCKTNDSLVKHRHGMLVDKVVSAKSFVTPERLPPTESATKYHSFRTYYQILVWKSTEDRVNAQDWGWYLKENDYCPTLSDMAPAPQSLLKMIRCSCRTGCVTLRCSCKQNGLLCSSACGHCQMHGCDNGLTPTHDDTDED